MNTRKLITNEAAPVTTTEASEAAVNPIIDYLRFAQVELTFESTVGKAFRFAGSRMTLGQRLNAEIKTLSKEVHTLSERRKTFTTINDDYDQVVIELATKSHELRVAQERLASAEANGTLNSVEGRRYSLSAFIPRLEEFPTLFKATESVKDRLILLELLNFMFRQTLHKVPALSEALAEFNRKYGI